MLSDHKVDSVALRNGFLPPPPPPPLLLRRVCVCVCVRRRRSKAVAAKVHLPTVAKLPPEREKEGEREGERERERDTHTHTHTHTHTQNACTLQQQNVEATLLLPGRRRPVQTPRQMASQPGTRSGGGRNCWCCVPGGLDSVVNHTLLFYFHTLLFYFMRPRFRLQCLASTRDEVSVGAVLSLSGPTRSIVGERSILQLVQVKIQYL